MNEVTAGLQAMNARRGRSVFAQYAVCLAAWLCTAIAGCTGVAPVATPTVPPAAAAPVIASAPVATAAAPHNADDAAVAALVAAIDVRLDAMRDVAAAKWVSGAPILDAAREQVVLQQVAMRAAALGLDATTVQAFIAEQIRMAREVQQRWHAQWKAAGRCAPCDSLTSLEAVRERIESANEAQQAALYLVAPLRSSARQDFEQRLLGIATRQGLTPADVTALASTAAAITRITDGAVLDRIRATNVLRIGTTGDYAPFSHEIDGALAGADIDLAVQLAAHLGAEPQFVRTSWPGLSNDLRDGRFDVALSGISYTPERAALGLLSAPYHAGGKTLLARCADRARFDSRDELDQSGVRVIVNPGGTNERYVREHVHTAQVIVHPDNRGVFAEIAAGRADVMVTDDVEAELQARRWPGTLCRTLPGTLTPGEKRILMLRDAALQGAIDDWLRQAIAAGVPARALERAMQDAAAAR